MTTQTIPAAERAAQLAAQREQIEARRASLAADLAELEQQQNAAARDAYAARPDVAQQRADLAAEVGTLERQRQQAIAAGGDADEITRRLIGLRVELELADRDLAQVSAMAAQVESEILAEQRAAEYERLVAEIATADAAVSAWLAGVDPALAEAVADVEAAVARLLTTMGKGHAVADHAAGLRQQAQHLAGQVGRAVPLTAHLNPVEDAAQALHGDWTRMRAFLAAARGDRATALAALTELAGR